MYAMNDSMWKDQYDNFTNEWFCVTGSIESVYAWNDSIWEDQKDQCMVYTFNDTMWQDQCTHKMIVCEKISVYFEPVRSVYS